MIEPEFVAEDEVFGADNGWRLLHRDVVDGQRVTMRGLGVKGQGVLVRMSVGADGSAMTHEAPFMVKDALIVETVERAESMIASVGGQPLSTKFKCLHREMLDARMARERFQPKLPKGAKLNPSAHLDIRPGIVLTTEVRRVNAEKGNTHPLAGEIGQGQPVA